MSNMRDEEVHTFHKEISPKDNVIMRLEFERIDYHVTVLGRVLVV